MVVLFGSVAKNWNWVNVQHSFPAAAAAATTTTRWTCGSNVSCGVALKPETSLMSQQHTRFCYQLDWGKKNQGKPVGKSHCVWLQLLIEKTKQKEIHNMPTWKTIDILEIKTYKGNWKTDGQDRLGSILCRQKQQIQYEMEPIVCSFVSGNILISNKNRFFQNLKWKLAKSNDTYISQCTYTEKTKSIY